MKKGFTLIELLAVIVILAIVSLIAITSVGPIISKSEDNLLKNQKHNIEEAAKVYYLKKGNLEAEESCVNVSKLIEDGYIETSEILNPKDNEPMTGSVKITYSSNQYKYKYDESVCGNE